MRTYALVVFAKKGRLRFLSHLDVVRAMTRAARRSRLPVAYTQGYNQHARLTFAHALPVGVSGAEELCAIGLERPVPPTEVARALSAMLPEGLRLVEVQVGVGRKHSPFAELDAAEYEARLTGDTGAVGQAVGRLLAADSLIVQRQTKKGSRKLDIRPHIHCLHWEAETSILRMVVDIGERGSAKPTEVAQCLSAALPNGAAVQMASLHRVRLLGGADRQARGK